MSKRACPCGSGDAYDACCAPLHRGEAEAADAPSLMRSRFAAFALKETEYLWRTLHPDHDDRSEAKDAVMKAIREACTSNRYLALDVLDAEGAHADADGVARVLFKAKIFSKGKDLSFVELSDFAHDGEGWRYLRGEGASAREMNGVKDASSLTIASFRAARRYRA